MQRLYKISSFIAANMTIFVVVVTALALFLPRSFDWISTSCITPMLGVVMFGMGLTLKASDFKPVLMRPKDIFIGELAQFIVMPLVAWLLCRTQGLPLRLQPHILQCSHLLQYLVLFSRHGIIFREA